MEEPIKILDGFNGQIELYKDRVTIKRKGFTAKLFHGFTKGEKSIYITQLSGVQIKDIGFTQGYIQFTVPGGIESRAGSWDAHRDENTVVFADRKQNQIAQEIKELISQFKFTPVQTATSAADEIKKFKQLLDDGIVTQEEFEKKRKQLLNF